MGTDPGRRAASVPAPGRNRGAAALALTAGVAMLGGCGSASLETARPAQAAVVGRLLPAEVPLQGTTWQLIQVERGVHSWWARPDSTLVIGADGGFLLRACNNVFGALIPGREFATFNGGRNTWRRCSGVGDQIDKALAEALDGPVAWTIHDRSLELHHLGSGVRLKFRVQDGAQPPVSAATVVTLVEGGLSCRVVVGSAAVGERLYALSRARPGGPWRLVRGGPAAPGEGPMLAQELLDVSTGRRCVTGFAPLDAAGVRYSGVGAERDLRLYRVPGIEAPIYAGTTPPGEGTLLVHDGSGRLLVSWPTAL